MSEDWVDITDKEQRKVEMILGADLEIDDHRRFHESHAVVGPNSFHSFDDGWLGGGMCSALTCLHLLI